MLAASHSNSGLPRLAEQLARWAGSPASHQEFASAVAAAFVTAQAKPAEQMFSACRNSRCYGDFCEVLVHAAAVVPPGGKVLALGVSRGWAARNSEFAYTVCRDALPAGQFEIRRLDLTPAMLRGEPRQQKYDLVVSHSLVHFFFDLDILLDFVKSLVRPSGSYVMVHEPNSRFSANSDCERAARNYEQARRHDLRNRMRPSRIANWVASHFRTRPDLAAKVNMILNKEHGWRTNLSWPEIAAIVDPHFPPHSAGLNWAHLGGTYLAEFEARKVITCGHLGRSAPTKLPEYWRRTENQLRKLFPLDGSMFSAWWSRRPDAFEHLT